MALQYALNAGGTSYSVVSDSCTAGAVVIPNTYNGLPVTAIGINAFNNCTTLTSIIIGNNVTSIGDGAFFGCTNLTSIIIPNGVTSIGSGAFAYSGLLSVTIPNSVTNIETYAFDFCSNLTSVTLGSGLTRIDDGVFRACGLISITIPNSVTSIDFQPFNSCVNLTSVIIPNSVISIGSNAFANCTSLTSINIPSSVTTIAEYAFSNCTNLIRINFLGNAPTLGENAFNNTNINLKIYRYSTKSGWSSTFDGKDVLLIDSPIYQNLQTFAFPNISFGKVSIKKQNLGGGKLKTYKNLILNSKFDLDNEYPYAGYDANYLLGGPAVNGGNLILTNYYHNSPLFFEPNPFYYITFANRTFHDINSPYTLLSIGAPLQPRLMKLFGAGSKMGRPDNNTNYLRTITSTTSLTPTDSQSWVKYGVEQIVAIPASATKIRYGVTYLVKSDDNLRLNNFGGLSLYFQKGSNRSYVNFCYIRNESANAEISSLQSLYSSDIYTNFNSDLGSNAMCQWLGPNTSKVKVRKRSNVNLASVAGGLPQYLDNLQVLEDTIDIPTFSTSGGQPDANNGFPEYVSLQMFFAEWVGYLNNSGINSGAIYFYKPFLYFI